MNDKREKPLFIDMDFSEALRRFAQTDKREADELAERDKRKKKPGRAKAHPVQLLIGRTKATSADAQLRRIGTPVRADVLNTAKPNTEVGNNPNHRFTSFLSRALK